MRSIVIVLCVAAVCFARPQKSNFAESKEATILQYENNNIGTGPYSFGYQTSDGVSRQETAELVNAGTEDEYMVIKGSYSYIGSDGIKYTVNYIADKNGFMPQGAHIPTL